MARGDQLARQWKIIKTLIASHTGKSAAQLANELECNARTVYRDLDALQAAGFPLYTDKVDGTNHWSILDTLKHHIPIPFTVTELLSLYFSRDMLKSLQNTVFYDSLESLFQKIKTTIPPDSEKFLKAVQGTFYVSQKQYKEYGKFKEIINSVNDAVIRKKAVEMMYYTMGRKKKSKRRVDPYRVLFLNGTFYIIGYCHMRKEIRTFSLDRIKLLTVTDDSFVLPEDFSIEEYIGSGFGIIQGTPQTVRIWFAPEVAVYIKEKTWHDSQVIHNHRDESITFEAEVALTEEIKSWIMSWGSKAEVLEPESLREDIRAEVLSMQKAFNNQAEPGKEVS